MWKEAPEIGSEVGGMRYQMQNGANGYLVSSVEQAAERIVQLIEIPDLACQMGDAARESVSERFLMVRRLEQYLDLLASFETEYRFSHSQDLQTESRTSIS